MPYPQNLDQMFMAPFSGQFAMQQFDQALQTDKNANAKSLQDMMFAQQEQPMKMDQMRATTRNTNATADKTELDNKFSRDTWDDKIKAEVSKFAREIDDNQLKQINAKLERDMMSPDPQVRAQAQRTYQFTKEMTKFKEEEGMKHGNKLSEIKATGAEQRGIEQMRIDAGKYNRAGSGGKTMSELIAKLGYEKAAVFYDSKAMEAELDGDLEGAAHWHAQADKMKQADERRRMLAAQAAQGGKVDTGSYAGLPTVPQPQPQGFGTPQQAQGEVGPVTKNPNAQQPSGMPKVGEVRKGYKFKGGNPALQSSWEKVN
jgi:hypothetical protein